MLPEGSAYLDGSGRLIAADDGFRAQLGIAAGDVSALLARAEIDPPLRALLAGDGADAVRVGGQAGPVELVRTRAGSGMFLRARSGVAGALEHAMQSLAVARIAGGVAHDVKNPLNAMALQIALLTDKIGGFGEPLASACANNLASLRNQISRVNEVVRRLADVSDPAPTVAFDLGALAADVAGLFGHESRRRGVALTCDATGGVVHARGDAVRTSRLLLGLAWRALSGGDGGALSVRAVYDGPEAAVCFEHRGSSDPSTEWIPAVAADALREMGGRLVRERAGDTERLELRLRRESAT